LAIAVAVAALTAPAPAAVALGLAGLGVIAVRASRRRLGPAGAAAQRRALLAESARPGAAVLGADEEGLPVVIHETDLRAHSLILGASGSGKTQTMLRVLEPHIARGGGTVVIDLKGSPALAEAVRRAAEHAGRRCRVFSLRGGERWNPLAVGTPTELKDKLIATERFTEPHYQRAAERYVQAALGVLSERGETASIGRVVELLDPGNLVLAARTLPQERRAQVGAYVHGLSGDQLSAVRGLAARLAVISESEVGPWLASTPGGIDLRRALDGDEVVVFSLNSSSYGGLAAQLGTLAVQDLVAATGDRQARDGPTELALVAIDEFSALGSDNVISLLARGREAGAGVVLATQELADLDRAARGLRDQVVGSTNVQITHRQNVAASARAMADGAGTRPGWAWSITERASGAPVRTAREVRRPVVEAERIQRLATGEAMVQVRSRARTAVTRIRPPAVERDGLER
jgi:hypothetical protein